MRLVDLVQKLHWRTKNWLHTFVCIEWLRNAKWYYKCDTLLYKWDHIDLEEVLDKLQSCYSELLLEDYLESILSTVSVVYNLSWKIKIFGRYLKHMQGALVDQCLFFCFPLSLSFGSFTFAMKIFVISSGTVTNTSYFIIYLLSLGHNSLIVTTLMICFYIFMNHTRFILLFYCFLNKTNLNISCLYKILMWLISFHL